MLALAASPFRGILKIRQAEGPVCSCAPKAVPAFLHAGHLTPVAEAIFI
jgi:hypothetical protein